MRDYLIENSIWKDQGDKDKFLAKEKRINNEFWINFLGFLGLYAKYKDNALVSQYFKQSSVRLEKVTDADSDLMVILKVINEKKVIPDMIMDKITKLLAKIKSGSLTGLDENLIRSEILKKIKVTTLYPYPPIAKAIKDFIKGNCTISDMLPTLYDLGLANKRAHEFRVLYKRVSNPQTSSTPTTVTTAPDGSVQTGTVSVSPVKSALTGQPSASVTNNTVTMPANPVIVARPQQTKPTTWPDIAEFIGTTASLTQKSFCELMYMAKFGTSSTNVDMLLNKFSIHKLSQHFSIEVLKEFIFDDTPSWLKTQFPDIEKLHTPIKGDFNRISEYLFNKISVGHPSYFTTFINILGIKDPTNFYKTATFAVYLGNYYLRWRDSLKSLNIESSYIEKVDQFFKGAFPECLSSTVFNNIFKDCEKIDYVLKMIFGTTKFPIVKAMKTTISFYYKDDVQKILEFESDNIKEVAKYLLVILDRNKGSDAYIWAESVITLEDILGDKLTFEKFDALVGADITDFPKFYNTALKDSQLSIKEFIEKYNLPYSEFLKDVKGDSSFIKKYLILSFIFKEDYNLDSSYLIDDLLQPEVFTTNDAIGWLSPYLWHKMSKYLLFYCLDYLATKKDWGRFNQLVNTIKGNSLIKTSLSGVDDDILPKLISKVNSTTPEYRNLIEMLSILHKRYSSYSSWDPGMIEALNIDPTFVFENPEMFFDMVNRYEMKKPMKWLMKKNFNLAKSDGFLKYIRAELMSDDSYLPINQYEFNAATINSIKDEWIDHALNKGLSNGLGEYVIKDLDYLCKINVLSKDEAQSHLESKLSSIELKDTAYKAIFSSDDQQDLLLTDSTLLSTYCDTPEKINDYLIYSGKRLDISNPHIHASNVSYKFIRYFNNNSHLLNSLYEKGGIDSIVSLLKSVDFQTGLSRAGSAKQVFHEASFVKDICINLLSSNDKSKMAKIDEFLDCFPEKFKRSFVAALREEYLIVPLLKDMYSDDNPLKPKMEIDSKRLKQLLKYNNFAFTGNEFRKKPKESWADYFSKVNAIIKDQKLLPATKIVEKIEETQDQLYEKTVEYLKYYNGKHDDSALEFLESYTVSMKAPEFDEFKKKWEPEQLIPAFHGSGMIPANFILRMGFTIIPSSDPSSSGKALMIYGVTVVKPKADGDPITGDDFVAYMENGYTPVPKNEVNNYPESQYHKTTLKGVDGIYISNIIEKSAQYIGEGAWRRKFGTVGIIYEMEANLGKRYLHWERAGVSANDPHNFKSPEWSVTWPKAQLNIVKVHKVKFVSKKFVNELKEKYPHALKENKYFPQFAKYYLNEESVGEGKSELPKFTDYLQEETVIKEKNVIRFVFYETDYIPTGKDVISWKEFETKVIKKSDKMYIDSDQMGIAIVFRTDKELDGVVRVPFTSEFVAEDTEGLYSMFLNLLDECKG